MGYQTQKYKGVRIFSNSKVLKGEKERCSKNFNLSLFSWGNGVYLYFPPTIMFDLKADYNHQVDPYISKNLQMKIEKNSQGEIVKIEYAQINDPNTNGINVDAVYVANVRNIDGTMIDEDYSFDIYISREAIKQYGP